jgi:hypothetical protein
MLGKVFLLLYKFILGMKILKILAIYNPKKM